MKGPAKLTAVDRFRLGIVLARAVILKRRTPLAISYIITNRCNFHCAYCNRWRKSSPELTTAEIRGMLRQLQQLGTRFLQITGGEPCLRTDLMDVLREARACGFLVGINSNGSLVDRYPELWELIDSITFSLDGPPEVHEMLRPCGSFQKVMQAIETARAYGKAVSLNTTLTEHNTGHVDYLIDLAEARGATISFQPASASVLSGSQENPVLGRRRAVLEAIDRIQRRRRTSRSVGNSRFDLNLMKRWPYAQGLTCAGRYLFYRIDSNGDVMVCGRSQVPGHRPPNVLESGVGAALAAVPEPVCDTCYNATRLRINLWFSLMRLNRRVWGGVFQRFG